MPIQSFISKQMPERQELLCKIHEIIVANDNSVTATIGMMMKNEMILYNAEGSFKYGLASVKKHISVHAMPIYCSLALHEKYQQLLPNASFQKGCINFKDEQEMPLEIVEQFIADCSQIDLKAMKAAYASKKK
ncbi:DUF1801 domain-containing protein [Parasediminibacterium sp. JCM 36343]|uniref:DUF1801 domain-containing protein n=1 Tax=Parasediminibacterium sp. JCM 36343 TaxID=3374279 RepID=UPI00397D535A